MIEHILNILSNLPNEVIVFILGVLPISEVRGAIPFGVAVSMPIKRVLFFSIAGNIFPVIPALFLFEPVSNYLRRFPLLRRFFDWLNERTKQKASLIEKYEALGLALFVAVPLPMTGAWSGCLAATLFKIRFRYALAAIVAGVIAAAAIVTAVVLAGKGIIYNIFIAH
ncbi:MAG: small multi-drug export protein [Candidatus Omnitrophota bacterium]